MPTTLFISTVPHFKNVYMFRSKKDERIHKVKVQVKNDQDLEYLKSQLDFALGNLQPDRIVYLHDQKNKYSLPIYDMIQDTYTDNEQVPSLSMMDI